MNLNLSLEQQMLRDNVARYLREKHGLAVSRERLAKARDFDPVLWSGFAQELGILGLGIPTEAGGFGKKHVETMLVCESLGEALVVEPFIETVVIGGSMLCEACGPNHALLVGIKDGEVRLAVALSEPGSRYALNVVSTTAKREGEIWVLQGAKSLVTHVSSATALIVSARTSGNDRDDNGISLFLVDPRQAGIRTHIVPLIDGKAAADIFFENVILEKSALLGPVGDALPIINRAVDQGVAAVCAEAVGVMQAMLRDTIEYTKQRRQFGQTLSSFQVLRHRLVDMHISLQQAISAVYIATLRLDAKPDVRAQAASQAKIVIGRSGRMIAQSAVQLHGAIGVTDEIAAGHHFKRMTAIESQFGDVEYHLDRYVSRRRAQEVPRQNR